MNETHEIINEEGKYIDGLLREEIVWAIEHDRCTITFEGVPVHIVSHVVASDGGKVTKVKADV